MAEQLTPRTLDLEVGGSSLARRVVSLDKKLYSTLSLFTQVYKWIPVTYCWGVTLHWTSIASRGGGGVAILLGMLHYKETAISSGRLGLWLVCTFNVIYSIQLKNITHKMLSTKTYTILSSYLLCHCFSLRSICRFF